MKTAAILLFVVTVSTSLFVQSSAAPDPLLDVIKGLTDTAITGVGSIVEETVDTLVGKGLKKCAAYVFFLKDLGVVLQAAQKRLYELLTIVTEQLDKEIANASGTLKELLTKLNVLLKVLLKDLPELLKALVAAIVIPTEENLNKVEAGLQQLKLIVAKLLEVLAEDTAGTLSFGFKSTCISISNAAKDGFGAMTAVVNSMRRNKGD